MFKFRNSIILLLICILSSFINVYAFNAVTLTDNADILTNEEESSIRNNEYSITSKGTVIVETTNEFSSESAVTSYARKKSESVGDCLVLVIDMNCRYVYMASNGRMKSYVQEDDCYAITDNIYRYLKSGDYYKGINEALNEASTLSKGGFIKKPMKFICTLFASVFLVTVFVSVSVYESIKVKVRSKSKRRNELTKTEQRYKDWNMRFIKQYKVVRSSSSSSGGSSGSSGGGDGGHSSCGGGHSF